MESGNLHATLVSNYQGEERTPSVKENCNELLMDFLVKGMKIKRIWAFMSLVVVWL